MKILKNLFKKAFILTFVMCCLSCKHPVDKMIVKGSDGKFYILDSEDNSLPPNTYRLIEIDTNQVKVIFK